MQLQSIEKKFYYTKKCSKADFHCLQKASHFRLRRHKMSLILERDNFVVKILVMKRNFKKLNFSVTSFVDEAFNDKNLLKKTKILYLKKFLRDRQKLLKRKFALEVHLYKKT